MTHATPIEFFISDLSGADVEFVGRTAEHAN